MTLLNWHNKGHKGGEYPLFLGDDLGVMDTVNVTYPQLEELYQTQLSQIWNEFEVDISQDKLDMHNVDEGVVDLMRKTIMWQTVGDTLASRSILECLGGVTTNPELLNLETIWGFFEVIHARTYSHIIKQTVDNPQELMEEVYASKELKDRTKLLIKLFNRMRVSSDESWCTRTATLKEHILETLTGLLALESISFMSSFAVTFAIAETGVFQGIAQLVKLVCRDELLHAKMGYTILEILKNEEEWDEAFKATQTKRTDIVSKVVESEKSWATYLFSEGREVVGLNEEMLHKYVDHMSEPAYSTCGIHAKGSKSPLPYMDKWVDSSKIQTAAQELQITSYTVGEIEDDTDGLEF